MAGALFAYDEHVPGLRRARAGAGFVLGRKSPLEGSRTFANCGSTWHP